MVSYAISCTHSHIVKEMYNLLTPYPVTSLMSVIPLLGEGKKTSSVPVPELPYIYPTIMQTRVFYEVF